MAKQTICLVGRPNTGKSTLFNRIVGKKVAIIEDAPGITRDRIYSQASYNNIPFYLIDTGGIDIKDGDFNDEIKAQVEIGIEEADLIVFVVDAKDGITNNDKLIRDMLKKQGKKVVVAINKVDNSVGHNNIFEFYSLGFDEYYPISAEHGTGVNELLKNVTKDFDSNYEEEDNNIKIAVIGRPNVGKSSLTNAILNQDRVIVSNISGTTRDSIDTPFKRGDQNYLVIDTAGLKKRGKIYESIDKYSAIRALKAIERSEIVLLVLDGKEGITEQDKHVIQYATDLHKAIIIVVNKWDLVDKQTNTMSDYVKIIREEYKFLDYAPVVFVSALKKQRLDTLFETLDSVHQAYYTRIKTSLLNEVMQDAQVMNQAPNFNGGRLKILYASQVSSAPPTIVLFVNDPNFMHFSYQRYIENRLRDTFNFDGTPIRIVLKKRTNQSK